MTEKIGTKELGKIIEFMASIANLMAKALEDKHIGLTDLPLIAAATGPIMKIMSVDYDLVLPEYKDLDEAEVDALYELLIAEFDIPQDTKEEIIETYILKAKNVFMIVKDFVSYHKQVSAPEKV